MARKIHEIAAEIEQLWKNVSPTARPYLSEMHNLEDKFSWVGCDGAQSIVTYFICNASGFKGPDARRIKQELRSIIR